MEKNAKQLKGKWSAEKMLDKYNVLDSYNLESDGISAKVHIVETKKSFVKEYFLTLPFFGEGTTALMKGLKNSLIAETSIKADALMDQKFVDLLKERFRQRADTLISAELPDMDGNAKREIIGSLLHEMLGLGRIEMILADSNLEEIVINKSTEPVWVYHKKHGWLKTNVYMGSEEDIHNYGSIIARRVGKQITTLEPLLDAHLTSGDRVNATLFPISNDGNTLTIRRFRREPWTVTDLIRTSTVSSEVMALLWEAIEYELNIIFSGGTASGKTTTLGVCLPFIQANHRILSIEDSVSGESEILYEHSGVVNKSTVGELIDSILEDDSIKDSVVENDEGIKIPSMAKDGKIEWKEPSKFIRHWVKKNLLKITLKSGREVEVTQDHSLFTLGDDGKIIELAGSEIKKGTWIATPRMLEWAGRKVVFNLKENIAAFEGCFLKSIEVKRIIQENRIILREKYSKSTLDSDIRNSRAPVGMLLQLQKAPHCGFIASRQGTKLPLEIEVDEDLACLAGLWLADGCYDKNSVLISVVEPKARAVVERVAARFGLKPKMHSDGITLMLNSKPLKCFFEKVMGLSGNAYTKKMPKWVFSLEKKLIAAVLRGYFSGDGWVRKNDIAIVSCSRQLLKDAQTMLLRFGIGFRIKWKQKKDKTYEARISGTEELRKYAQQIGFVIDKKNEKSAKWLSQKSHDVSDVIPLPKHFYKQMQKFRNIDIEPRLSKDNKIKCYQVSNIGRQKLQKFVGLYPKLPQELHELAQSDVFWDPVEHIESKEFEGFVYDFSVPENESFVCNNTVCHNTRELKVPDFMHYLPLTTREPNPEGKGGVEMLDLLVNSLRMRPDRIIVGETRRGREAEVMFEAMHTGHSVYSTIHANTADETIRRLTNPPINIPESMLDAVHLNVVMFRNRRLGVRRVLQVAEFILEKHGTGEEGVRANVLYRWRGADDKIAKHNESVRLFDELSLHTGLDKEEVLEELKKKQKTLDWMVKQNINDVNSVGKIIAQYYKNPSLVLDAVDSKKPLEE